MKSLHQLLSALLSDVKRLLPEAQGLDRDILTIKHRVEHEGDSFLAVALPTLCDALDKGLASGRFACPSGFSKIRKGALPKLFSGLLCKVFDSSGSVLEEPEPEYVKVLREVLRIFKKLDLGDSRAEMLDYRAKAKFCEDDAAIAERLSLDDRERHIMSFVTRLMLPNLEGFDPNELMCKNGPGAVAEGCSTNGKWRYITAYDRLLEDNGMSSFYLSRVLDGKAEATYGTAIGGDEARLVTVPKSTTARRTITIEPVRRQFVQQGLNVLLRSHIERCKILGRCLSLSDQGENQKLAMIGSQTGDYATLDLQSASDLLSLNLVREVFKHQPNFLAALESCRSARVIVDNDAFYVRKYAGMGNATTFPVQSVVFAVLSICAAMDGSQLTYRNLVKAAANTRVYGDDIIVRTTCAEKVIEWLSKAGLRVNTQKSFLTGKFRESCGVDAFAGIDVTPVYLRASPSLLIQRDASALAAYVATSNSLWERCYYKAASVLSDFVEKHFGALPLVPKDSGALGWHTRVDATTIEKWNRRLHRFEFRGVSVRPQMRKDKLNGYPALLKFFVTSEVRQSQGLPLVTDPKHLEQSPKRFSTRIARRWMPSN